MAGGTLTLSSQRFQRKIPELEIGLQAGQRVGKSINGDMKALLK